MSPSLRILTLQTLCLLLLLGCRSSPKQKEGQTLHNARDATVYVTIVTRALASLPLPTRPSASLGIHLSTYLSKLETTVHGALENTAIIYTLARTSDTTETPFMTIQTLGNLIQTNIVEAMNKNPERGDVLNRHLTLLRSTLQNAQKDKRNLEDSLHQLVGKEREQRNTLRTLQKEINAAEKAIDFQAVGFHQRALREAKGEHGKTEASLDELEKTMEILDDLTSLAEERLNAIEENRKALMAGIRVVEIPGLGTSPRRSRRQERGGGLLDFSDL
ncbi:hypothetical protein A3H22_01920 [Candidatus Peribacteria bacterium RIFCSPLOWO2_12_FULL_55_15]|nr:MAG: hypothetical protein A2789_03170 [Candidatus Peribacteria bacterium RIFCSPHIGHO2_01_FULL_54_22]OGJ62403.1 MAG: hypothetical protein A3D12_01255 [Candidatus Peribacteria bacterium RIFCSPHIGHO2_02_FULL_55_24]OGJ67904.1 MAG: hypothetical protein A2947_03635 [Candidatus Peribacteria bacterium RIFCSPLOWO2_01_FULL_54_110]OGJ69307.1 MAG: hypothetical protein A3H90_00640 [Candidatus Peribacteria bacterium RIFCSPLOWO2_02_FULL_55_36]OGJ70852.1 MAG: hypothetical protein A3H22_01920 [Candidatus Per